jgi:septum formation protein
MNIILASSSPHRAKLLDDAGIKYEKVLGNVDEEAVHKKFRHENVSKRYVKTFVREVALAKLAPFVGGAQNGAVVTADTVVFCGRRIIGKPHTKEKCREQHLLISGRTNYVFTAVAVHYNGKTISKIKCSPVKIAKLLDEVIEEICNEPYTLNCAGYRTTGAMKNHCTFKKSEHQNIIGLDVALLRKMLQKVNFPLDV